MRQIEERKTVIGPGAVVRLKKEATSRLADLMARWRVLGIDEELIRVEDVNDVEDTRTFNLEDVERVSGGIEVIDSTLVSGGVEQYPEHDKWPTCMGDEDEDAADFDWWKESGSLFDDPDALLEDDEDEVA